MAQNRRSWRANRRSAKLVAHAERRSFRAQFETLETRIVLSHDGSLAHLFAMPAELQAQASADNAAAGALSASPFPAITYDSLPNGIPILNSFPSAPAAIYLDFDGDVGSNTQPYDIDGNPSTFNATEAANIVETWRQMSLYFAMFNVNVTTVQPNVSQVPTAWIAIGNNISGAYSGVNVFPNNAPRAFQTSSHITGRISATAHEIGHNFGNWHTAGYNTLAEKTNEYHNAFDPLHGPLMGLDYTGVIHKWTAWHDSTNVALLQDDMARIANKLAVYGGDGYRPDDYGGTIATAAELTTVGTTQAAIGILERLNDADAFSFTSDGGRYSIMVGRDAPSGVDVKVSVFDVSGTLLATQDGDPRRVPYEMVNDTHLTLDLDAGQYYIVVQSHGNYGDLGQYIVRVDPLPSGWTSSAVGLVGVPGYSSYDATTQQFTVAGSGHNISSTSDAFQFMHQTLTGDGSITVRIDSMEDTAASAKSGIMIRESLANNARDAFLVMTPQHGVQWWSRSAPGGSTTSTIPNPSTPFSPRWLRIVRSGNTFTAFQSVNGTNWTQVGSPRGVTMGEDVYIGIVTSAVNNVRLNEAKFSGVALVGNLNAQPELNDYAAPSNLNVTATSNNSISIEWSGVVLPGDLNADGVINAADVSLVLSNFGAVAVGEEAIVGDANGDGVVDLLDYNLVKNAMAGPLVSYAIERSSDNVNFTQIGAMSSGVTTLNDSGLSPFQQYFYRVRTVVGQSLSEPSEVASSTTRAGVVTGLKIISHTAFQLIVTWTDASGETSYQVQRSLDGQTGWATVGTLARNTPMFINGGLSAGTQYFYRVLSIDAEGQAAMSPVINAFTRLSNVTGLAFTNKAPNQMAIQWNAVTGATGYRVERSTDNTSWSTVSTNQPGLSYADNSVAPVVRYYYRVTALSSGGAPSTPAVIFAASPSDIALPSPWQSIDIGINDANGGRTGAAHYAGGTFTIIGGGADIWGSNDQFRFTYVEMSGNTSITARVTSLVESNYYSRAGIMIRQSTATNSRYAAMMIHQTDAGVRFQYRGPQTLGGSNGNSSEINGPSNVNPPHWVRLTRSGNTFTGEISSDGQNWTTIATRTVAMNSSVLVGLALTPRDNSFLNRATFTNVTIPGAFEVGGGAEGGAALASASVTAAPGASSTTSKSSLAFHPAAPGSLFVGPLLSPFRAPPTPQASFRQSAIASVPTVATLREHIATIDAVLIAWNAERRGWTSTGPEEQAAAADDEGLDIKPWRLMQ